MKRPSPALSFSLVAGAALLTAGCAGYASADPSASASSASSAGSAASAASGTYGAYAPAGSDAIAGAQWRLKSDPSAWFRVRGSNISGNDSCNTLTGTATALTNPADRVDFGQGLASTQKACADPNGTQAAMRDALKGSRAWKRNGTDLVLSDDANSRSWTFVLAAPAAASSSAVQTTVAPEPPAAG